jgi:maltose alpha-D-glucosyltransferase/alpha-amylase
LLEGFVSNQGDGWDYTVNYLVRFLEERVTQPARLADAHGLYLTLVRTLATRTAQLHAVLAAATEPALAPEPIAAADLEAWRRLAHAALTAALKMLAEYSAQLAAGAAANAATVLARRAALLRSVAVRRSSVPRGLKIRCHGDFHLRQVLLRRNDFIITDVGAAGQSVAAQRRRCSPLADVASMLRSFAYARRMALQQCSLISANDRDRWEPQLDSWEQQTRTAFLDAYDESAGGTGVYESLTQAMPLLRLFELEAACADLQRALIGRPDWVGVPLRILLALSE